MSNTNPTSITATQPAAELTGAAAPTFATELRCRRELLGWSQAEAARRSGVSRTVINEIECSRRMPHTATYERLRRSLGLELPTAQALLRRPVPESHTERQLTTLAACLVGGRGGTLAALAEATAVSIAAVREQLSLLPDRLAAVGLTTVEDGLDVRLLPLPWAAEAVPRVTTVEVQALTSEAVEVLIIIGVLGSPARREIEDRRGGDDCASLLDRLCRRGLLEKSRDDSLKGDPNVYRLTAVALGAMGHGTLESFQFWSLSALHQPADHMG